MRRRGLVILALASTLALTASGCDWMVRATGPWAGGPGGGAEGGLTAADLSGDGRFVVFTSRASDLVPGDGNGLTDVFVKDVRTGEVERVSVDVEGGDADGPSGAPRISADGRYVVFESTASDLVEGDTDGQVDVFLRDRTAGTTVRLSDDSAVRARWPDITADGRFVVYARGEVVNNLFFLDYPDLVRHDLQAGRRRWSHRALPVRRRALGGRHRRAPGGRTQRLHRAGGGAARRHERRAALHGRQRDGHGRLG